MFENYSSKDIEAIRKVGSNVKTFRNRLGISQNELGLRADITKNQIGRIERGTINTSLVALSRIATALEVSLKELFDFEK